MRKFRNTQSYDIKSTTTAYLRTNGLAPRRGAGQRAFETGVDMLVAHLRDVEAHEVAGGSRDAEELAG